jgi:hypothetical protein
MSQAWLQVIGLVLDFLGFALIGWEWMLAQRSEAALQAIEGRAARAADGRAHLARVATSPEMQRHLAAVAEMERRRTELAAGESRQTFGRLRMGVVYLGFAFVTLGFIGQLLAAWPGCCRVIGIIPGA